MCDKKTEKLFGIFFWQSKKRKRKERKKKIEVFNPLPRLQNLIL